MTIQQIIAKLKTRRRECERTERDPDSGIAKKRMASKQIAWIDRQLDVLEKAAPKKAETRAV